LARWSEERHFEHAQVAQDEVDPPRRAVVRAVVTRVDGKNDDERESLGLGAFGRL
jgi:hypothetical protein